MDNSENIDGVPTPSIEDIEREIQAQDQENKHLRSRTLGLTEALESNFLPKGDSNVIEFKLSPEELLERIEHYLRGDILKSRQNEEKEMETYYTMPTKKITVSLFVNTLSKTVYVIDEHPEKKLNPEEENKKDPYENWEVLSLIEPSSEEGVESEELVVEENYKELLLAELKKGLLAKKKIFKSNGRATKEVVDKSRINLNEYGISEIMNTLSMYINKETFLSFYKEERINEIMADIGDKLNEFLLINGKLMGLDTEFKKTKYPIMIVTILHTIESSYRRALLGNENRGTREGILITQHQPQQGFMNQLPMTAPKKKWNPLDKSTW